MKIYFLFATGLLCISGLSQNAPIVTATTLDKIPSVEIANTNLRTNSTGNSVEFTKSIPDGQLSSRKKEQQGLSLNYIIALEGAFPAQGPPQVQGTMIGEIKIFTGNNAPYGWAFCQGQLLSVSAHPVLFQLIGTTYGGDGRKSFALPDLRSAVPVGVSSGGYLGERSN